MVDYWDENILNILILIRRIYIQNLQIHFIILLFPYFGDCYK